MNKGGIFVKRAWYEFINTRTLDIAAMVSKSKEYEAAADEFGKVFKLVGERIAALTGKERPEKEDWELLNDLETAHIMYVDFCETLWYGMGLKDGLEFKVSLPDEDLIMIAKHGDRLFPEADI